MLNQSVSSVWQSAKVREKLTIIVGLAYVLLPFDFIPEIILGPLGLLDDGGAVLVVLFTIAGIVKRQRAKGANVIDGDTAR